MIRIRLIAPLGLAQGNIDIFPDQDTVWQFPQQVALGIIFMKLCFALAGGIGDSLAAAAAVSTVGPVLCGGAAVASVLNLPENPAAGIVAIFFGEGDAVVILVFLPDQAALFIIGKGNGVGGCVGFCLFALSFRVASSRRVLDWSSRPSSL